MIKKQRLRQLAKKYQAVTRDNTRVCLGGEWDFKPHLARSLEDMWSTNFHEGTDFVGFRLVRETA